MPTDASRARTRKFDEKVLRCHLLVRVGQRHITQLDIFQSVCTWSCSLVTCTLIVTIWAQGTFCVCGFSSTKQPIVIITPTVFARCVCCICEQYTHRYSTHRVAHSMITFHHANTRGSTAGRLRIAHLCVTKTIVTHASCLIPCRTSHTDHKHKFSLTNLINLSYLSESLTSTHNIYGPRPHLPCDVPRQSDGSTQIPSHTIITNVCRRDRQRRRCWSCN